MEKKKAVKKVEVNVEFEHFDGELEFISTGKSKHLKADLVVKLTSVVAELFLRLGYVKQK